MVASPSPGASVKRPVWVGTSWKMTKTISEALAFVDHVMAAGVPPGVQPLLLPAHTALASVRQRLPDTSPVLLGAQNAHWGPEGAGTGEVSMRMVADAGAEIVEIGHSERREQFAETDAVVAAKVRAALDVGLTPLVCVGEPATARGAGKHLDFVTRQVRLALAEVAASEVDRVIIAYEPVWAIGESGRAARPDESAPVLSAITDLAASLSNDGVRALLYGGSVDHLNADAFLNDPHIDGLFVGRAAWTAKGFLGLLAIAGRHAASRRPA